MIDRIVSLVVTLGAVIGVGYGIHVYQVDHSKQSPNFTEVLNYCESKLKPELDLASAESANPGTSNASATLFQIYKNNVQTCQNQYITN